MSVTVISTLKIRNNANAQIIDAEDALGAWSTVPNITARDAIQSSCRREHMVVTLADTGISYELSGGILNANWVVKSFNGGVSSVFTRTGAVVATLGDYAASLVTNDSGVTGATVKDALNTLSSLVGGVSSVFARTGAVVAAANDYAASLIANDSSVTGTFVKDALNTLAAAIPSVPVSSVFARTGAVVAAANDYAASLITNDSSVTGTFVKDALNTLLSAISALGPALKNGGTLPDSDATFSLTSGNLFTVGGPNTANRSYTLDRLGMPTSTPGNLSVVAVYVTDTSAFTKTFINSNTGSSMFVVPASTKAVVFFIDDGTNWNFQSQAQLQ